MTDPALSLIKQGTEKWQVITRGLFASYFSDIQEIFYSADNFPAQPVLGPSCSTLPSVIFALGFYLGQY